MTPSQTAPLPESIPLDPGGLLPGSNLPVLSVSELSLSLKRTVEDAYGIVRVRGEISQPKRHGSGHLYLRLKDDQAVLEAVCWRGTAQRLSLRPEDGMEVICAGRLTTYPARSNYQLVIESMELAGEGALLKLLEERRRRLAAEGLFDAGRKRPLPFLPDLIGVITSPTGAVIRDILHRLNDRFPRPVLLWPVAVQGNGAAEQIAEAIAGFNALPGGRATDGRPIRRPDLLIVARGGGSLEDLMPFNEEIVVRAAAASAIPLISAVGHETDTTLIDHAADLRAPTPTAAAELAVPVRATLLADLLDRERRRIAALARLIVERRLRVEGLARGLGDPARLLDSGMQRLDDRAERLTRCAALRLERLGQRLANLSTGRGDPRRQLAEAARQFDQLAGRFDCTGPVLLLRHAERLAPVAARLDAGPCARGMAERRARLDQARWRLTAAIGRTQELSAARLERGAKLLDSYSYRDVLRRGFAVVRDAVGIPVTDAARLTRGTPLTLEFRDDKRVEAMVTGSPPAPGAKPAGRKKDAGRAEPDLPRQGKLF